MLLPLTFLLGVVGLALPAYAGLGTGVKFQIVPGGKAFDRFITIWLENQVRRDGPLSSFSSCARMNHAKC